MTQLHDHFTLNWNIKTALTGNILLSRVREGESGHL